MPSIYNMVVHGLSLALEFYFVDIQVTGREVVPDDGPIILAANHPNSIMDTLVLATQTRRKIRYLARSGLFKNPAMSAVFHYFGAIPVYRAQDDPARMKQNASMFDEAWNVLDRGGCIGIFPEGQNSEERRVLKIRTGVARIALGAEARREYKLGVRIVPVGLNFEDRDRFMSSVLVSYGKPIEVSEFAELHREDERAAVRELTERVGEAITEEALHIEDEQLHTLIRDIHAIYGQHLLKSWFGEGKRERGLVKRFFDAVQSVPGRRPDVGEQFWVKRQITEAMGWFHEHEPEVIAQVRTDVLRYKRHLEHARLRHELLERSPETLSLRRTALFYTLYAVIFAIPALLGVVFNAIPYLITRYAASLAPDEPIRAITAFGTGLLVFPLFYGPFLWWLWGLSGSVVWPLLVALMLPVLGFFSARYRQRMGLYHDRILVRTLFRTNRILLRVLSRDRDRLIERLEGLHDRYLKIRGEEEKIVTEV